MGMCVRCLSCVQDIVGALEQEPTPDLEGDTLSVLCALCLAQAQEMVVLKAVKDKMKDNITVEFFLEILYAILGHTLKQTQL